MTTMASPSGGRGGGDDEGVHEKFKNFLYGYLNENILALLIIT